VWFMNICDAPESNNSTAVWLTTGNIPIIIGFPSGIALSWV
jgi:hypothetical protein